MNHIMVDLETLAETPNAVFPSLAAVQFNLETGEIGKKFSMNISIDSAVAYGLVVDASTIGWWFTQSPEVSALMFKDPKSLTLVLYEFQQFLNNCTDELNAIGDLTLWGNSARYDLGKLAWAYKAIRQKEYPWNTWNEKCYRTYTKLFPEYGQDVKKHDVKHDPIQDCEFQIRKLVEVNRMVKLRCYQDTEFEEKFTESIFLLDDIFQQEHLTLEMKDKVKEFMDGTKRIEKSKLPQLFPPEQPSNIK